MRLPFHIMYDFLSSIREASDRDWQERVWLNINNGEKYESSFDDLYNDLVDSSSTIDILSRPTSDTGLSNETKDEIRTLIGLMRGVEYKNKSEKEIIESREMDRVRAQAKRVLKSQKRYYSDSHLNYGMAKNVKNRIEELIANPDGEGASAFCEWILDLTHQIAILPEFDAQTHSFYMKLRRIIELLQGNGVSYENIAGKKIEPGYYAYSSFGFEELSPESRRKFRLNHKVLLRIIGILDDND